MNFKLKLPCGNCPFRREGAITLNPGRVEGIIDDLLKHDYHTFHCHKTVHHPKGGEWTDDGAYKASGNEAACMGAVAYMWQRGHTSVMTRIALAFGDLTEAEIVAVLPLVLPLPQASP